MRAGECGKCQQLGRDAFAALIQQCGAARALDRGKSLHAQIASLDSMDKQTFLGNLLVQMYGQCGSLPDAVAAFRNISNPNIVSGNIMISAFGRNGNLPDGLCCFHSMPHKNVISWTTMLSSFAQNGFAEEAERIFAKIPATNVVSWNAMLTAYAHKGDVDAALNLFDLMPERDLASWNAMILAFANNDQGDEAGFLYRMIPATDVVGSTAVVTAFAQRGDLDLAKQVFDSMPEHNIISCNAMMNGFWQCGFLHDSEIFFNEMMPLRSVSSWNSLLQAYGQCGQLDSARKIFDLMPQHDSVTWTVAVTSQADLIDLDEARRLLADEKSLSNVLLLAYTRNGYVEEAEDLFRSMAERRDAVAWTAMISGYSQSGDVERAVEIFEEMPCKDLISWTAVITVYAQRGQMESACKFFQAMPRWDAVVWNAMVVAYGEDCDFDTAKSCFDRMLVRNSGSWSAMISAAVGNDRIVEAKEVFEKSPTNEAPLWNLMIQACVSCGLGEEARDLFDSMPAPDSAAWTIMINAHAEEWPAKDIIRSFCRIDLEGVTQADEMLFSAALEACGSQKAVIEGRSLHSELQLSCSDDLNRSELLTSAIISMYCACSRTDEAREVFDGASEELRMSSVAVWNAIISGCIENGENVPALELYHRMVMEGLKPEAATFNAVLDACAASPAAFSEGRSVHRSVAEAGFDTGVSSGVALITMYGKWGCLSEASEAFEKVAKKNVFVRTAMISAYAHNGRGKMAMEEFGSLDLEGIRPDPVTYISALDACGSVSAVVQGKLIHEEIRLVEEFERYPQLRNALLSFYSRCGCLEEARAVFERLPDAGAVSGSAMMSGLAQNGHGEEAVRFFMEMQLCGVAAEGVTFLSVLAACSHAGMVEEGRRCFTAMRRDYWVEETAEHFSCMVDVLARCGRLAEAEELIQSMPFEGEALSWMSLLAACKSYGHVERGERAAARVLEVSTWGHESQRLSSPAAPYILFLSSVHASSS